MTQIIPGISVVLCCYNSAKRLPQTLSFLLAQQVPKEIKWEVILVDNVSTDDTCSVALKTWNNSSVQTEFRIAEQPIPGLSNAREKGIETARYSFILFCDDDNWLDPHYVARAYDFMMNDANIGVAGGLAIAAPEPPVPLWLSQRISHYSVGSQEIFAFHHWVYGAGSICRKEIFLKLRELNWKQVTSDRLGDVYLYGGDNELCYMIKLMGYKIVYNGQLTFQHFIPQERLNEKYIEKSAYGSYLSEFFLYPYFYYLSKRFKYKSFAGFLLFACLYFAKTFFTAVGKFILSITIDGYQRKMTALQIKAMIRSLSGMGKITKQFKLINGILKQVEKAS